MRKQWRKGREYQDVAALRAAVRELLTGVAEAKKNARGEKPRARKATTCLTEEYHTPAR